MNEKFVVPMGIFTNEIPSYWLNFLFSLDLSINDWRKESNRSLKQYNAVYVEDPERLIFDSEQDYMLFVLRWS
jgi:hypothetical protein